MKHLSYILLLAATSASAQSLRTEITVDRTIVPAERTATRLSSVHPSILTTQVAPTRIGMTEYDEAGMLTRSARTLAPAAYADTFTISPYRGYVQAGYFPAYNLGLSAGYNIIRNSESRLSAWGQFNGYNYKAFPSADSNQKGTYRNNTFAIGADYDRRFGRAGVLTAAASFSYGNLTSPQPVCDGKRGITMADVRATWYGRASRLGYHAGAELHTFGYSIDGENDLFFNKGTEVNYIVHGGVTAKPGDGANGQRLGLEVRGDFLSRPKATTIMADPSNPQYPNIVYLRATEGGTLGVVSLTPYYTYGQSKWLNLRLGAKFDISTGTTGKKFHVAPAAEVSYNTSGFSAYARAGGGETLNSQRSLYAYSVFSPLGLSYDLSHLPFTIDGGVNIGPFAGISVELFGGWARANDWLMPTVVAEPATKKSLICIYAPTTIKGAHGGVRAAYEYRSLLHASVSAEFAPGDLTGGYYRWLDRSQMVLKADVGVNPIAALELTAAYELRSKRAFYSMDADRYDLGNASLLSFGARYAFSEQLSVFARGENLLGSKYYVLPFTPAQGVHGLIGAAYRF